jgi:hypothetical protein
MMHIILCLMALMVMTDAHAYIDPGSGSFMLQIMIASTLAFIFSIKMYFYKMKQWIKGKLSITTDKKQASATKQNEHEDSNSTEN